MGGWRGWWYTGGGTWEGGGDGGTRDVEGMVVHGRVEGMVVHGLWRDGGTWEGGGDGGTWDGGGDGGTWEHGGDGGTWEGGGDGGTRAVEGWWYMGWWRGWWYTVLRWHMGGWRGWWYTGGGTRAVEGMVEGMVVHGMGWVGNGNKRWGTHFFFCIPVCAFPGSGHSLE